jgi:hypothetical protein
LADVIEIRDRQPKNGAHWARLMAFCREVLAVCHDLGIEPVLSGSLAVFGYTQDPAMRVNDIDLACSEREFPRLCRALEAQGIVCVVKAWHVLQARSGDLKVEFDSLEHWMADVPGGTNTLVVGECAFKVVSLAGLTELYRRGLEATAGADDENQRAKHSAIAAKFAALCSAG